MNATNLHLINQLRFEVSCSEETLAFKLRKGFAQTFQPEIVTIIDKVCSEYVSGDECLQIETLEIDLGRFSPQMLARDFATVFREQFEKELTKKLNTITVEHRKTSKVNSQIELFSHFMLQGTLPWWSSEAEIDINGILQELYACVPEQSYAFFYQHRKNPIVWTRAAFQLNDAAKQMVISLFKELQETKTQLLQWAEIGKTDDSRFNESTRTLEVIHDVLLRHAPDIINVQDFVETIALVLDAVIKEIAPDWREDRRQIAQAAFNKLKSYAEGASLTASIAYATTDALAIENNPSHQSSNSLPSHTAVETDAEPRYIIHHSGVMLLAPFFKKFFDACGLLDGSEWKHKDAQYQAVHLLKYLTTGAKKTAEYSLMLEKLICGIAVEEPIPLEVNLQAYQLDEARALLAAAIDHWQVLKNTSIDGLRETFLKRDGLITRKNDAWLLQVERKTLDVLLDSIPWGYSSVILPWNDYLIHVEW